MFNVVTGVRVGGAVSMNPSSSSTTHKEFPPLPPAPDERPPELDCEYCGIKIKVYSQL